MTGLAVIVGNYRQMFEKGENLRVIDLFYADNIEQVENNEDRLKGKTAVLEQEKASLNSVNSFAQKITSMVIDESNGIVMGEMEILFDSKKHGPKKLCEAFIQYWKDNRIVYQKFYYKPVMGDNNG